MVKICFDYGHGGKDSGAIYNGRKESMDNLSIGRDVAKIIRSLDIEVGETRLEDKYLSLKERVDFANRGQYNYFISFHRNAYKPEKARGVETFIYGNASHKSYRLALQVQRALVKCGFEDRGVKMANFYVLRKTGMPAVLVETGFIDNSVDNRIFDENKKKIIHELAKSIILEVVR